MINYSVYDINEGMSSTQKNGLLFWMANFGLRFTTSTVRISWYDIHQNKSTDVLISQKHSDFRYDIIYGRNGVAQNVCGPVDTL